MGEIGRRFVKLYDGRESGENSGKKEKDVPT